MADRREELLAAAAEVFAAHGYRGTTVRRIASEVGMLAGSLYHHFDSKESMLDEILAAFLGDLRQRYEAVLASGLDPWETLEALVAESFRAVARHPAAVAVYRGEAPFLARLPRFGYLADAQRRFARAWRETLERGVADGVFRADLDVRLTHRFLRDAVWVAASRYRPGGRYSPEDLARHFLSLLLTGIAARN
ncbi:TetR/AcrR family transcriptional regulator [Streptomyces sp. JJ36]|uniref:TetR/AcrR family transcriptional regulator n=1 Tax=Streptomyces sp. JJ36 TaxID=2736645 RepID=UPI001F47B6C4|nr:TetR/AcrR family transcriptional regulator [Streptomyces sp. JJ36]MCF6524677.1 TetR family transcriptional regulator [Streptomyces sp. JJ36]